MENPLAMAGKHPYITGAIIVGVGVLVVLSFTGSGSSGTANNLGTDATAYQTAAAQNAAANDALVQTQIAGQVQSNSDNNALKAQLDQDQAAITVAQANFDMQNNANVIAGNVAMAQIEANKDTTLAQYTYESLASNNSLSASIDTNASAVKINGQNNSTSKAQIAANLAQGLNDNQTALDELNATLANSLAIAKLNVAKTPAPSTTPPASNPPSVSPSAGNGSVPVFLPIPAPGGGYYPGYMVGVSNNGKVLGGSQNQYR